MPQTNRRMVFHAQAIGFGGIIGKENKQAADRLIDVLGVSALPGSGGRHSSVVTRKDIPYDLQRWVDFDRITTKVEGRFTDPGAAFKISSDKNLDQSHFETTTMSEVTIENLTVLGRFRAGLVTVKMFTGRPLTDGASSFYVREQDFKEVSFDNKPVAIETAPEILSYDSFDRLQEAFGKHANLFFEPRQEKKLDAIGQDIKQFFTGEPHKDHDAGVLFTFVSKVSLDGVSQGEQPNRLEIPEFGHVVFGEVRARKHSRRVGMLRFHLGSDDGMMADSCAIEDNGSWVP
ncbi:MAG: hypothetical protein SFV51_08280 [Bryobacteraceae bacterium]|nr:hypothetical protein [Bryobacteraceae bacterium]